MITLVLKPPKHGHSSFKNLVSYVEAAKPENGEKCLYVNWRGFDDFEGKSQDLRIKTMIATAAESVRCKDPVWHGVMSFCAGEVPTKEQIEECMDIYLKEYGFEGCQVVYAAHQNTDFIHIHVALNRIHPETGKAVDTWKSYKTGERVSRMIELQQGWEQAQGGKFYKVDGDEVVALDDNDRELAKSLKQETKDFERRSGEKSATRIAQNKILTNLWQVVDGDIENWNTLHKVLAEKGFEIKKEGRGAVVVLHQDEEEIAVKLSSLNQKFSLGKFEKKLGEFEARPAEIKVRELSLEPLIDNHGRLTEYIEEKKDFYAQRRALIREANDFKKFKRAREAELRERQKKERAELFGHKGKWKGRGAELNKERALLAAKHLSEKQELQQNILEQKDFLPERLKQLKRTNFPDYCVWEEQRNNPDAKWRFIYAKSLYGRVYDGEALQRNVKPVTKTFLQSYVTLYDKKNGYLSFCKNDRVAFRDAGKRITIILENDKNIEDALLLGKEKWGKVRLSGTDEFKKKALDIALRNNIKVTNPELQELITLKQKELETTRQEAMRIVRLSDNKVKEHMGTFLAYTNLLTTNSFRITCAKPMPDGKNKTFLLVNETGSREMTPLDIAAQWDKIEKLNKDGWNIYTTPVPEANGKEVYILVDDLSKEKLQKMKAAGWKPAAVFESSPGNYQAIIIAEKPFVDTDEKSRQINKAAANMLMTELNEAYGDKNIRAAIHPHRIPGMNNNKLKRIAENGGIAPEVKLIEFNLDPKKVQSKEKQSPAEKKEHKIGTGIHCPLAGHSFNKHVKTVTETLQKEDRVAAQRLKALPGYGKSGDTIDPATAFVIHARDIINHHGVNDYSRLDAEVVVRMRATGYNTAQIKEAVASASKAVRPPEKRNKQWAMYAERTAKYSESFACMEKIRQQQHRIGAWYALEGRTRTQQQLFKTPEEIAIDKHTTTLMTDKNAYRAEISDKSVYVYESKLFILKDKATGELFGSFFGAGDDNAGKNRYVIDGELFKQLTAKLEPEYVKAGKSIDLDKISAKKGVLSVDFDVQNCGHQFKRETCIEVTARHLQNKERQAMLEL